MLKYMITDFVDNKTYETDDLRWTVYKIVFHGSDAKELDHNEHLKVIASLLGKDRKNVDYADEEAFLGIFVQRRFGEGVKHTHKNKNKLAELRARY